MNNLKYFMRKFVCIRFLDFIFFSLINLNRCCLLFINDIIIDINRYFFFKRFYKVMKCLLS